MVKRARVGAGLLVLGVAGMCRIATLPTGSHPWALPLIVATTVAVVTGARMVRSAE